MRPHIFIAICANICVAFAATDWGCFGINDEFQCGKGRCVHSHWTCDGEPDCDNGKDEENCDTPDTVISFSDVVSLVTGLRCRDGYYRCGDGACIRSAWECDGDPDCTDGSDEANCESGCGAEQFECDDGSCIKLHYTCDWERDCADGSDESHKLSCNTTCNDVQFQCGSGKCISGNWKCDGDLDCADGSDEANVNCGKDEPLCLGDEFNCGDGYCIRRNWKCDGDIDCDDSSDEAHCDIEGWIDSAGSESNTDDINISVVPPSEIDKESSCSLMEWSCDGGQLCIRLTWLCDGDNDCEDQSDEHNCPSTSAVPSTVTTAKTCQDNQFQCDDEKCIRQTWRCDGDMDCADGSDELNCGVTEVSSQTTCKPSEFQCNDGSCIYFSSWQCDGELDCEDGSDELQCDGIDTVESTTESPSDCEFRCSDGLLCILESWKCDGEVDCVDGSDELGCETSSVAKPESEIPVCSYVKFRCENGKCIKGSWECDGDNDCGDGSDEDYLLCNGIVKDTCKSNEFQCTSGKCIDKTWKCDTEYDCEDKSDEVNCNSTIVSLCRLRSEFRCGDGTCVEQDAICDGHNDCPDKSDEAQCDCGKRTLFTQTRFRRGAKYEKIVDGTKAEFGEFPWQVSLRKKSYFGDDSRHSCGAVLLNTNWVITAAHCIDGESASKVLARMGEYDFSHTEEANSHVEMSVKRIIMYPKYNSDTYEYDLALLQLSGPVKLQPNISPICLPGTNDRLTDYDGYISGWGTLQEGKASSAPDDLRKARIPVITNARCSSLFRAAGRDEKISDVMLCAGFYSGGPDTCQGDSGGPLQIQTAKSRWMLAGVVSWGIGCGGDLPGVYTRVSKFVPWILKHIS